MAIGDVRGLLGEVIFARVAGDEGPARRERIMHAPGPRRFAPDSAIATVHGDASMFVGGIRALLLQTLHPLAMAAVDQNSGFRGDPWGRLHRTSAFLAVTTFGADDDADRAIRGVRAVHERISGTAPDGRPYRASDPELLRWVHVAEVDSFLRAHDRYGAHRLSPAGRDTYVRQAAVVGRALGADQVPETVDELEDSLRAFRPMLQSTSAARATARYLLLHPPVPLPLRAPYGVLAAAGVALLPTWARLPLRLPWLPVTEASVVRAGGELATRTIRWAMTPAEPAA